MAEKKEEGFWAVNFFEIMLLIVGLAVGVFGFFLIYEQFLMEGVVSWNLLICVFLWLLLLIGMVALALLEDVKQELASIMREHTEEIKLLRQDTALLADEDKLLGKIAAKLNSKMK